MGAVRGRGFAFTSNSGNIHSCLEVYGKDRSYTKVSRKEGATFIRREGRCQARPQGVGAQVSLGPPCTRQLVRGRRDTLRREGCWEPVATSPCPMGAAVKGRRAVPASTSLLPRGPSGCLPWGAHLPSDVGGPVLWPLPLFQGCRANLCLCPPHLSDPLHTWH